MSSSDHANKGRKNDNVKESLAVLKLTFPELIIVSIGCVSTT